MIRVRLSLRATGLVLWMVTVALAAPPADQSRSREENGRQFIFLNPRASLQSVGFNEPLIPITSFDRVQTSGRESFLYIQPEQLKGQAIIPQSNIRFETPGQHGQGFILYTPGFKQGQGGYLEQFVNLFSSINPFNNPQTGNPPANPPTNQQLAPGQGQPPNIIQQAATWFSQNNPFRRPTTEKNPAALPTPAPAALPASPIALPTAAPDLDSNNLRSNIQAEPQQAQQQPQQQQQIVQEQHGAQPQQAPALAEQRFYILTGQPQFFGNYELASHPQQPIFSLQPLQPIRPAAGRTPHQEQQPAGQPVQVDERFQDIAAPAQQGILEPQHTLIRLQQDEQRAAPFQHQQEQVYQELGGEPVQSIQGIGTQFEPQQEVSVRLQPFSGDQEHPLQLQQQPQQQIQQIQQIQQPLAGPGAAAVEFARYLVQRRRPVDQAEIQKRFSPVLQVPVAVVEKVNENEGVVVDAKEVQADSAVEGGVSQDVPLADPSVSQSKPAAIAVAGPGGVASAAPVGSALAGAGGLALSAPSATAVAGPDSETEDDGQYRGN